MTRNDFMTALRKRISHLPLDEQDAALKYYEEYFDEAASQEEAAQQLGSPDLIADRILSDYGATAGPVPPAQKQKHSPMYWVGMGLLILFASPFLLGLGGAALGVAIGLFACIIGVIVCIVAPFLVLGVVLVACFFMLLYAGAIGLAAWVPGGILILGLAFLLGGLGLLSCVFTGYLCYWIGLLFKTIFTSIKPKKEARKK